MLYRLRQRVRETAAVVLIYLVASCPTHILYACSEPSLLHSCSSAAHVVARGSVAGSRDVQNVSSNVVVATDGGQKE